MTLFAGIVSRNGKPPAVAICETLRHSISRHPADEVQSFGDAHSYFVKVDIGAFGEPALRVEAGAVSMLAGEPILSSSKHIGCSRGRDLDLLHAACKRDNFRPLTQARGTFCAAHYQLTNRKLLLISDKLGLRPIYYFFNDEIVVFATALRIFEGLNVPLHMDVRGTTEIVCLGYALSSRTPYTNISLLKAAEILEVTVERAATSTYWHWNKIARSTSSETHSLSKAKKVFSSSVALRNRHDRTTFAYLSGGLDSRCVVATLRDQGVGVHTFNFALSGSQDLFFGDEFAERIGSLHESAPRTPTPFPVDFSSLMSRAWAASILRKQLPPERSALVWSGEGGSVGLGHVHLNPRLISLTQAGLLVEAVNSYLEGEHVSIPHRLLKPDVRKAVSTLFAAGIRDEVTRLQTVNPGREFYLFLLLNDQRRKLADHFEKIDLHRLELQLPFFDSEFLTLVTSLPIEWCLGHQFYMKWLNHFQAAVTSVPWQTYPGHESCPIQDRRKFAYQWDRRHQASHKGYLLREASKLLCARDFPHALLRRGYLICATIIYLMGLRDYGYVIRAAQKYYHSWKMCGGRHATPIEA